MIHNNWKQHTLTLLNTWGPVDTTATSSVVWSKKKNQTERTGQTGSDVAVMELISQNQKSQSLQKASVLKGRLIVKMMPCFP